MQLGIARLILTVAKCIQTYVIYVLVIRQTQNNGLFEIKLWLNNLIHEK